MEKGATIVFGFRLKENKSFELTTNIEGLPVILLAVSEDVLWNLIDNYEDEALCMRFIIYLSQLINTMQSEIKLSPKPRYPQDQILVGKKEFIESMSCWKC